VPHDVPVTYMQQREALVLVDRDLSSSNHKAGCSKYQVDVSYLQRMHLAPASTVNARLQQLRQAAVYVM
jgi:hypothetical protein